MMMFNQIDRANIGYAQGHLESQLGIGAAAYGLGAGLFFLSYFLFEVPSNVIMQKVGARLWITRICITWGAVSMCMMFVQDEWTFYLLRFLLGAAEAGFVPAVLFYIATWLPNSYRGRANAIWAIGALAAYSVGGIVSGPLLSMHGLLGLEGWQWLFLIEGGITVVLGVVGFFLLDSRISEAKWLTPVERDELTAALASEQAGKPENHGSLKAIMGQLRDPQILLFAWIYFAVQMAIYATTFWLPAIIRQIGVADDISVGFLSALPWLCALGSLLYMARRGDRTGNRKPLLFISLVVAALGTILAGATGSWLGLVFICLATMGFKSVSPVFWPIVQERVSPVTVGLVIAVINSLANLGGFIAPYGFGLIKSFTGDTRWGLYGLGIFCFLAAISVLFIRRLPVADSGGDGERSLALTSQGSDADR
ncbi:MFS transporter [Paenarthrobacter nitroguajacolicus]|uniref:MFS transporter n=1 Tax=Paenarthrobacter nitroguajacolicus TaxID=211146 RepID=UPI002117C96F|nr:MFS transporter [Paenarthrobacter nitroguajacolicus]